MQARKIWIFDKISLFLSPLSRLIWKFLWVILSSAYVLRNIPRIRRGVRGGAHVWSAAFYLLILFLPRFDDIAQTCSCRPSLFFVSLFFKLRTIARSRFCRSFFIVRSSILFLILVWCWFVCTRFSLKNISHNQNQNELIMIAIGENKNYTFTVAPAQFCRFFFTIGSPLSFFALVWCWSACPNSN